SDEPPRVRHWPRSRARRAARRRGAAGGAQETGTALSSRNAINRLPCLSLINPAFVSALVQGGKARETHKYVADCRRSLAARPFATREAGGAARARRPRRDTVHASAGCSSEQSYGTTPAVCRKSPSVNVAPSGVQPVLTIPSGSSWSIPPNTSLTSRLPTG